MAAAFQDLSRSKEHAERQMEDAIPEAYRGEAMELALNHKRRMMDLEYETAKKRTCSEVLKMQAEDRKVQVETYVSCFESVARLGVFPDHRARLYLHDLITSELH
jgi:hypothetical protein